MAKLGIETVQFLCSVKRAHHCLFGERTIRAAEAAGLIKPREVQSQERFSAGSWELTAAGVAAYTAWLRLHYRPGAHADLPLSEAGNG